VADGALPVLMYHGLHAGPQARGVFDPVYSVEPRTFARQLDWLVEHGYRTLRVDELGGARPAQRCVLISFDDGDVSNLEVAQPLLAQRRMVAEFFVTAGFVGRTGMLCAGDVRALADAGMGVQAHGLTHAYLDDLSADELARELFESKRRLEAIVGRPVSALALPGGRGGHRERDAAVRAGYEFVLDSRPGDNRGWQAGDVLQRLAITRSTALEDFARLVTWRGLLPRTRQLRYHALAGMKRLVGNERYASLRARVLGQ
jgi:peptidoglycan/xylan/chitin deacetylase (PgdA/CDA1 family)